VSHQGSWSSARGQVRKSNRYLSESG